MQSLHYHWRSSPGSRCHGWRGNSNNSWTKILNGSGLRVLGAAAATSRRLMRTHGLSMRIVILIGAANYNKARASCIQAGRKCVHGRRRRGRKGLNSRLTLLHGGVAKAAYNRWRSCGRGWRRPCQGQRLDTSHGHSSLQSRCSERLVENSGKPTLANLGR